MEAYKEIVAVGVHQVSGDILDAEFLVRIEGILDALEVRGKNSTEFLLCSELQTCVEWLQGLNLS